MHLWRSQSLGFNVQGYKVALPHLRIGGSFLKFTRSTVGERSINTTKSLLSSELSGIGTCPAQPPYLLDLIHEALRLLHCDILHGEFQRSHPGLIGIENLKRKQWSVQMKNTGQNTDYIVLSPEDSFGFLSPYPCTIHPMSTEPKTSQQEGQR